MYRAIRAIAFAYIQIILSISIVNAETAAVKVIGISDGDTITILIDGSPEKIRLHGIDCPEQGQDYGTKAKQFTSSMAYGKSVSIKRMGKDRYGRTIGWVQVDDKVLNEELVRAGYAWHYKKYSSNEVLAALENEAREKRVGLWAGHDPIPPWEYRNQFKDNVRINGPPLFQGAAFAATKSHARIIYHGNVRSHKFHRPSCRYYNCKNCVAEFKSREAAIKAGYVPCKICRP
ncbi:thermonuclease family protein [Prosthecochloris sp. SCSIO W1102]|uniref:thermonuclease family protein n=1 Tax=Prosthecochloris sp. SCSIO W1102 TaxID=2992243 RepID=UPI00223CFE3D|nr:thermonuclease family protein [Prosthecochloris sp. SCSIO W1102]UZJ39990.1 thermonuclease family protein [Prosthecochloris sp. SCSIO W1102]